MTIQELERDKAERSELVATNGGDVAAERAARVAADATEAAARQAADAAIIASGLHPSDVSQALVAATGSSSPRAIADWFANINSALADTLYVSPNGNDANGGRSWADAKETILAAYDALPGGGTICIANGTFVDGEVPNQGIWLIGSNDPLASLANDQLPPGWRREKPMRFLGCGGNVQGQFGTPYTASIRAGQPVGSGAWTTGRPAIHLAGTFAAVVFENIAITNHDATAVALGLWTDFRSNNAGFQSYVADGQQTEFTIPWTFDSHHPNEIVRLNESRDALVRGTAYTVSGGYPATTGAITFSVAPAAGTRIKITRPYSMVATQWFKNCLFAVIPDQTEDYRRGPTVDIGYAFWVYFDDSVLHGYPPAPLDDDRHACVRILYSGLQWFTRGRWAQGGIITYNPGVFVEDVLVESDSTRPLPPVVWFRHLFTGTGAAYGWVRNVARADPGPGSFANDVRIDTHPDRFEGISPSEPRPYIVAGADKITVVNCTVEGPCVAIGSAPSQHYTAGTPTKTSRSLVNRSAGIAVVAGGHLGIVGPSDASRRQFAPTAVLAKNYCSNNYAGSGGITATQVTGPDGRSKSAWRLDPAGITAARGFVLSSYPPYSSALGDIIVIAAWLRFPNGQSGYPNEGDGNGGLIGGYQGETPKINRGPNYLTIGHGAPGDGNWIWRHTAGVCTDPGSGRVAAHCLQMQFYWREYPVDVFQPTYLYIPPSPRTGAPALSENELGEVIDHLQYWSARADVGDRAMEGDLALTDGAIKFWNGNDMNTKILSGIGSPEGVVSAAVGSLYMRLDGGVGTTLYVKEVGTAATGWAAK